MMEQNSLVFVKTHLKKIKDILLHFKVMKSLDEVWMHLTTHPHPPPPTPNNPSSPPTLNNKTNCIHIKSCQHFHMQFLNCNTRYAFLHPNEHQHFDKNTHGTLVI